MGTKGASVPCFIGQRQCARLSVLISAPAWEKYGFWRQFSQDISDTAVVRHCVGSRPGLELIQRYLQLSNRRFSWALLGARYVSYSRLAGHWRCSPGNSVVSCSDPSNFFLSLINKPERHGTVSLGMFKKYFLKNVTSTIQGYSVRTSNLMTQFFLFALLNRHFSVSVTSFLVHKMVIVALSSSGDGRPRFVIWNKIWKLHLAICALVVCFIYPTNH